MTSPRGTVSIDPGVLECYAAFIILTDSDLTILSSSSVVLAHREDAIGQFLGELILDPLSGQPLPVESLIANEHHPLELDFLAGDLRLPLLGRITRTEADGWLMLANPNPSRLEEAKGLTIKDFPELGHLIDLWVLRDEQVAWTKEANSLIGTLRKERGRLRTHTEFLEVLMNTNPCPIFHKDTEGKFLGCNEAFASDVLGIDRTSIVGCTVFDIPEVIPPRLAEAYHHADMTSSCIKRSSTTPRGAGED